MPEKERRHADLGTPELHQRHITAGEETNEVRRRTRVLSQVPIDYYLHQGWLSMQQWESAELLYFFWYYGAEKSGYVVSRDPRQPKGKADSMRREYLEQKYNEAVSEIGGLGAKLVVYNVVCLGEWARSDAELHALKLSNKKHYLDALDKKVGRNRRMKLLRQGLDDLARHFRIPAYPEEKKERQPA